MINIYQIFTRLFGNKNTELVFNGNRNENGVGKFNDITTKALVEIKNIGITHIWYTGVIEHAMHQGYEGIPDGNPLVIKGKAGSPYAIKDYYDLNPDLASTPDKRMVEFEALLKRTHDQEMKVIIDFVPNHLAREYASDMKPEGEKDFGEDDDTTKVFDPANNFYYLVNQELQLPDEILKQYPGYTYEENPAKATGNDQFTANPSINDWYETVKLNYGINHQANTHFDFIPDTWKKMESILMYWAEKGVDGFRCDMAEMVPVEFWKWVISRVKATYPNLIFIAEIYNPDAYQAFIHEGGFDYLYDKVGLYDTLRNVMQGHQPASDITACWQNLDGLDSHMLNFLENHDEQRIASRFFADDCWKGIPAMLVSATINSGPTMLYFGQEVGEPALGESGFSGDDGRTTIFDYWNVPEHQKWMNNGKFDGGLLTEYQIALRNKYQEILSLTQKQSIMDGAFYDLMYFNMHNELFPSDKVYAFLRYSKNEKTLLVANFADYDLQINVKIPEHALELMGIRKTNVFQFQDIILKDQALFIDEQLLITEGLSLPVYRNNYKAYKIL